MGCVISFHLHVHRNGSNASDFHCFQDVYIPDSVWAHSGGSTPTTDISSSVAADELPVPMILHEAMDARTFPRLQQSLDSYKGGIVDVTSIYTPAINKMRALGLYEENDRWADATEWAYTMYLKAYIENYRLDPAVSGYEWWLVWTYLGGSSGILGGNQDNPTVKPGISNETIRSLQSNVLLLVRDPIALQSTGHYPGELVPIEVQCSNWTFGGDPAWFGKDAQLFWEVSLEGGPRIDSGTSDISHISIRQGQTKPVAVFGVITPHVATASKLVVEVTLRLSTNTVAANHWHLAVFPTVAQAKNCSIPVFVEPGLLSATQKVCHNAAKVPSSLAAQTGPFVLIQRSGLTAEDSAVLARTSSVVLLLKPSNGWPVCNQSALGQVTAQEVRYNQPWWMNPGLAGTLLYNTSSFVRSLGFAKSDRYLDYSWASIVDQAQAYTLDNMHTGVARLVHIRAIPAFYSETSVIPSEESSLGTQAKLEATVSDDALVTTVSNAALVWEGKFGSDARFVVSGLNLFDDMGGLKQGVAQPVAEFVFSKLVSYMVSQAAAATTTITDIDDEPSKAFCVAGSEQGCQPDTVPSGIANANFEIVMNVYLDRDSVVDALHPRLSTRGGVGAPVVPVIYLGTPSPRVNNTSAFCSRSGSHSTSWWPQRLVAKGPATKLPSAANATWARLPFTVPTALKAGNYWIGILSTVDLNVFAAKTTPGKPAPLDAYAYVRPGPSVGPKLSWIRGTSSVAIYASTTKSEDAHFTSPLH